MHVVGAAPRCTSAACSTQVGISSVGFDFEHMEKQAKFSTYECWRTAAWMMRSICPQHVYIYSSRVVVILLCFAAFVVVLLEHLLS
jgi:hypothetical protein